MTSSIEEIINSVSNKFEASKAWNKQRSTPFKTSHGWSIEDVLSEMNIARDHAEPIEANLLLRSLSDKRFFTMDNQTIQQLPQGETLIHPLADEYFSFVMAPVLEDFEMMKG